MISIGIDIGGSSVKLAAVQGRTTLWTGHSSSYSRPSHEELVAAIREAAEGRLTHAHVVGICVPGILDRSARCITLSVNIPSLQGIVLDDLVAEAIGDDDDRHVEIANDSTASAYDLYVAHNLTGRLLSITLGTGVGATVLDDGIPVMLDGDSPGHLGQVDCSIEGEPVIGPDGGAGSLEGYIGAPALVKRYGPDMPRTLANLTEHDAPIRALARGIRIFHAIYRPEHVYFTGGIGIRLKHLLPALRRVTERDLTSVARTTWTLGCGDDEFHAAKGAAKLAASQAKLRVPPAKSVAVHALRA